ncbi:heterokaryon incompatibility protein-domain-containing protein [Nemania serpens]|nr:heterokaryon incompatibility protein-domain-containing protein [Nemania serpens]
MSTPVDYDESTYAMVETTLLVQTQEVSTIVKDLCQRDSRFQFIDDSLEEFIRGKSGLHQDEMFRGPRDSKRDELYRDLFLLFGDIVSAATYELLNIFDIDITLKSIDEEALKSSYVMAQRINLFKVVYEKSKDLSPQPTLTTTISPNYVTTTPQYKYQYQYPNRLDPSNIRILIIQPGPEESPIECQLEEHSINSDEIKEVLSYVWGKPIFDKVIRVNGSIFPITTNLHNILRGLRYRHSQNRTIWIDAICINQSDPEEKRHQVRLMADIYSKAHKTTIWLGDWPTEQSFSNSDIMYRPNYVLDPAHEQLRGDSTDEYDLANILKEFLDYPTPYDENYFVLGTMLFSCLNIIMMHEWWERVWTIQEAALSPNDPVIYFQGYSFPYGTLNSAIDAVLKAFVSNEATEIVFHPTFNHSIRAAYTLQYMHFTHKEKFRSLLRQLHRVGQQQTGSSNPREIILPSILASVSAYRASDPRDKIFALGSLMPRGEGRLINVNYSEPTEAVFRRITARCLNRLCGNIISRYSLLIDGKNNLSDSPAGPSWVHDFTYSDAGSQSYLRSEATLDGMLAEKDRVHPLGPGVCLATPKTLFCSGVCISIIYYMKLFPDLGIAAPEDIGPFLNNTIQEARLEHSRRLVVTSSFLTMFIRYFRLDDILGQKTESEGEISTNRT